MVQSPNPLVTLLVFLVWLSPILSHLVSMNNLGAHQPIMSHLININSGVVRLTMSNSENSKNLEVTCQEPGTKASHILYYTGTLSKITPEIPSLS